MSKQQARNVSFYCNTSAIDPEQRKRYDNLTKEILAEHIEIKELPDGYGIRFPNSRSLFTALSEWATLEQLCRPFLTLTLELERDLGPIWLKASGEGGVKDFLRAELGIWLGMASSRTTQDYSKESSPWRKRQAAHGEIDSRNQRA